MLPCWQKPQPAMDNSTSTRLPLASSPATASTSLGVIAIPATGSPALKGYRGMVAFALSFAASVLFILAFGRLGIGMEGLPWYICVTGTVILASRTLKLAPRPVSFAEYQPAQLKETVNLSETLAASFLAIASLLFFLSANQISEQKDDKKLEIVDIQLLSLADHKDNKAFLPGQQEQSKVRKRSGETRSRQGELAPTPAAPAPKVATRSRHKPKQTIQAKLSQQEDAATGKTLAGKPDQKKETEQNVVEDTANTTVPVSMPVGWFTKEHQQMQAERRPRPALEKTAAAAAAQTYFTEVSPPELVELTDNDGDLNALQIFQAGGISKGGTGAQNELSQYLKELNKQIKLAWNPPRGKNHKLVVLFRLNTHGELAFVKISSSSGDAPTDRSALLAVMQASKHCRFPKSFPAPYLDIAYTFLYNFDELKELQKQAK